MTDPTGWPVYPSTSTKLADVAGLADRSSARDQKGRFLAGNNGGGRKKGSRNKLTEAVLSAVVSDFEAHGAKALESLRASDSGAYLRLVLSLLPRDLILKWEQEVDYSSMTLDEVEELAMVARHNRSVRQAIASG